MGLFMLWWAFLAFNAGSTFGISGTRWMLAGKATVTTITSSFGGGVAGIMGCYIFFGGKMKVPYIVNSVFASLVSITGFFNCQLFSQFQKKKSTFLDLENSQKPQI
jgi:Amt family ammonium transporter